MGVVTSEKLRRTLVQVKAIFTIPVIAHIASTIVTTIIIRAGSVVRAGIDLVVCVPNATSQSDWTVSALIHISAVSAISVETCIASTIESTSEVEAHG